MSLVKRASFLEKVLLAGEEISKCHGSLGKLARHLEAPVMITGSLAMNWHLLANGRRIKKQRLNDIDVVVEDLASLRPSLSRDFLIRHFHPTRGGGRILIMLIDEEHATRIDVFTPTTRTLLRRLTDFAIDDIACRVVDAEDLSAMLLSVIDPITKGEPVEPKYVDRFHLLSAVVDRATMKEVWREYRKADQLPDFAEAAEAVGRSLIAHPGLLQAGRYSQDINQACPWCCQSEQFPLASLSGIYAIMGYV
ncbi:MAG: hypothetical protein V7641_4822 [Blastocatellia bacterium]